MKKNHHGVRARRIDAFECLSPQSPQYASVDNPIKASTPEECEHIAKGTPVRELEPHAQSKNNNQTNIISQRERLASLSSPEAMAMGHDVAIGASPRNFKGVIYAPQIKETKEGEQNEGYDKFSDMHWRAVWSRHGGSFDIIVDYPAPINNCRQANSNKPVNMEFYLDFPQICCNDRGPLIFHECEDKCWHSPYGPTLMDMELALGLQGDSVIQVVITEGQSEQGTKYDRESTGETCNIDCECSKDNQKYNIRITNESECIAEGGEWNHLDAVDK